MALNTKGSRRDPFLSLQPEVIHVGWGEGEGVVGNIPEPPGGRATATARAAPEALVICATNDTQGVGAGSGASPAPAVAIDTCVLKGIVVRVAAEHRAEFFEGVQKHSQIKLRALERYLPPWAAKVGYPGGIERVWVVDGFAGPGTYGSGEAGSPRIVLEHAVKVAEEGRPYQVSSFFVESDKRRHRKLESERHKFPDVEALCVNASFWTQIDRVVDFIADAPALVFIDPFGLKDLDFASLVDLCNRLGKVDLMVNFASTAAPRLEKRHPEIISQAVGGAGWTLDSLTDTFCTRLAEACDFLRPAVLPVVTPGRLGKLKYEIVLAARNRAAYELWSDEISRSQREVLDGDDEAARIELLEAARAQLRSVARGTFTRDQLIKDIQFHRCGDFHSRVLRAAVKAMLDAGEWKKDPGPIGTARMQKA